MVKFHTLGRHNRTENSTMIKVTVVETKGNSISKISDFKYSINLLPGIGVT